MGGNVARVLARYAPAHECFPREPAPSRSPGCLAASRGRAAVPEPAVTAPEPGDPARRAVCVAGAMAPWVGPDAQAAAPGAVAQPVPGGPSAFAADDALFEASIRPVLVDGCFRCHGGERESGGFRVDSREALLAGGDSGPAVVPGDPEASLLVRAIARHPDVSAMPPEADKALRPGQVADFEAWIRDGAAWPERGEAFRTQEALRIRQ